MVKRNKGLASQQTLVWDAENRLSQVQDNNGDMVEQYWYEVDGGRVKKVSGTTTTYTFFGHYEEEVTDGTTTAINHYSFGGMRIAVKRGNTLYHLHGDHLGSTSLTTQGSTVEPRRAYYAYGSERSSTGDLQTDRTFTGQKRDATGLMYYNARYYDPGLGTFVSPDSLVPGAGSVINYNRFLYAKGNPLKYSDPSGQEAYCFLGGVYPDTENTAIKFHSFCYEMLTAIGYTEEEHGEIKIVGNDELTVKKVYEEILALKSAENPSSRPIVLGCYSWGCPSAIEVATRLTGVEFNSHPYQRHKPVPVERLMMFEAEDSLHRLGPIKEVPDNVELAGAYFATDAAEYVFDLTQPGDKLTDKWVHESETDTYLFRAWELTPANGLDYIKGAVMKEVTGGHYRFWGNLDFDEMGREFRIAV